MSEAEEGDTLRFIIELTVAGAPSGGDCSETCIDPGEGDYSMRLDYSQPQFFIPETDDNVLFEMDEEANEWWMFTNENMAGTNLIPDIRFAVFDNTTGAPLNESATFDRDNGEIDFDREALSPYAAVYNASEPQSGDGNAFAKNTTSVIDVTFADTAGNIVTGELSVSMDHTLPTINADNSTLARIGGNETPASLDESVRVHVNATDVAGGVNTPPELVTVEARLYSENRSSESDWQPLTYNETEEHYFSHDVRVPSDAWDSGLTFAEVRVTDVVGNQATADILGNITVDADLPVIEPVAPLDDGEDTLFSADEDIAFIIRAFDAGDADAWDGGDTQDTDGLGINLDTVNLHYRIGEEGSRTTLVLEPQEENNTFRVPRSFGELDEVYHYFSAEDLAGNRITYPRASDPHHEIEAAGNDGRYLLLHTDRVGPDIEPSRDHTYLGGPDDHEYRFNITDDPGIGLDDTTPVLNWRVEGDSEYTAVELSENEVEHDLTGATITTFTGTIPRQTEEGTIIEYYVEAEDELGNLGNLGSASSPETTEIDLTPPTVTVTAPQSSNENRFNVTWQGQDALSGVRDFTLQFRVGTGTWHTAPGMERTALTSWEVCAATDVTYEFRVSARDNAGNERAFPEVADAATDVNAPDSCAQPPTISLTSPSDGDSLSGEVDIEWVAVSTIFPDDVSVRIEVGNSVIADGLEEDGVHTWDTSRVAANEPCFADGTWDLRVVALDPASLEAAEEITVTLQNGITNTDCDDRDPSSGGPIGSDPGQFNPLYLLVVVAFVGLAAVFAVGMARRW